MKLTTFLKSFSPYPVQAPFAEKLRSGLAAGLAVFLLALGLHFIAQPPVTLLLLGSMGASAALLYAVPHSPFAQPWNLVGGHLFSAICGGLSMAYIGDPFLAAGVAVGSAIFLMYLLNCLHPPGAATALTLVLGASQFQLIGLLGTASIVLANTLIMLILALLINNAIPRRHYPHMQAPTTAPTAPSAAVIITPEHADLEWALAQSGSAQNINIEDLSEIYIQAQKRAQSRYDSAIT